MFMWVLPIFFISATIEEEFDQEEQSEDEEEGRWSLCF